MSHSLNPAQLDSVIIDQLCIGHGLLLGGGNLQGPSAAAFDNGLHIPDPLCTRPTARSPFETPMYVVALLYDGVVNAQLSELSTALLIPLFFSSLIWPIDRETHSLLFWHSAIPFRMSECHCHSLSISKRRILYPREEWLFWITTFVLCQGQYKPRNLMEAISLKLWVLYNDRLSPPPRSVIDRLIGDISRGHSGTFKLNM